MPPKDRIKISTVSVDTYSEQALTLEERFQLLEEELQKLQETILTEDHFILLAAPEYFFARNADEKYYDPKQLGKTKNDLELPKNSHSPGKIRQLEEKTFDSIKERLINLSKKYPKIIICPGTIAWRKKIQSREQIINTLQKYRENADLISTPDHVSFPLKGDIEKDIKEIEKKATRDQDTLLFAAFNTGLVLSNGSVIVQHNKRYGHVEVTHPFQNLIDKRGMIDTLFISGNSIESVFRAQGLSLSYIICRDYYFGDHKESDIQILVNSDINFDPMKFKGKAKVLVCANSYEEKSGVYLFSPNTDPLKLPKNKQGNYSTTLEVTDLTETTVAQNTKSINFFNKSSTCAAIEPLTPESSSLTLESPRMQ